MSNGIEKSSDLERYEGDQNVFKFILVQWIVETAILAWIINSTLGIDAFNVDDNKSKLWMCRQMWISTNSDNNSIWILVRILIENVLQNSVGNQFVNENCNCYSIVPCNCNCKPIDVWIVHDVWICHDVDKMLKISNFFMQMLWLESNQHVKK